MTCSGTCHSPVLCLLVVAARNTSLGSTTSLENCAGQQILYLHRALEVGFLVPSRTIRLSAVNTKA